MKNIDKKGRISKFGCKDDIFSHEFFNNVRKRLDLTEKELPNKLIRKQIILANKILGQFIIDNPEGYMLKDMGVIAPSKHLPKEFREDKDDVLEKIQNFEISDLRRHQILQKYNVDIGRRLDLPKLYHLQEVLPQLNMNSYFYTYRIMWFNKRNCKARKAEAYEFVPARALNKLFADKIWGGKDYYELTFNDYYRWKIGAKY